MLRFAFHLDLPPEACLPHYQGSIRQVVVRSEDGQHVQFPAVLLRPFVTPSGIRGDFVLTCDEGHRGAELHRA